jgi:hypothetical protein
LLAEVNALLEKSVDGVSPASRRSRRGVSPAGSPAELLKENG